MYYTREKKIPVKNKTYYRGEREYYASALC
jgi:hypothetical protein